MAGGPRLDFRTVLRRLAVEAQNENARRLIAQMGVRGESFAPHKADPRAGARARAAIRATLRRTGESDVTAREAARHYAGMVGIRTGALLRDLTKRSNIKVTRTGFRITPQRQAMSASARVGAERRLGRALSRAVTERERSLAAAYHAMPTNTFRAHFALSAGTSRGQVARPFSGVSDEFMRRAAEVVAKEGVEQLVRRRRLRETAAVSWRAAYRAGMTEELRETLIEGGTGMAEESYRRAAPMLLRELEAMPERTSVARASTGVGRHPIDPQWTAEGGWTVRSAESVAAENLRATYPGATDLEEWAAYARGEFR